MRFQNDNNRCGKFVVLYYFIELRYVDGANHILESNFCIIGSSALFADLNDLEFSTWYIESSFNLLESAVILH